MVYTDYRPTPLQHFMFPAGGDGLHMIVDERGVFREDSFHRAIAALTAKDGVQDGEGECCPVTSAGNPLMPMLVAGHKTRCLLEPRLVAVASGDVAWTLKQRFDHPVAGRGTKGKKKSGGKVISRDEDSDIFKVVKMLMEHQYDPVSMDPSLQRVHLMLIFTTVLCQMLRDVYWH